MVPGSAEHCHRPDGSALPCRVARGRPVALPGGVHCGDLVRCGGELLGARRAGAGHLLARGDDVLLGDAPVLVLVQEMAQVLRRVRGWLPSAQRDLRDSQHLAVLP